MRLSHFFIDRPIFAGVLSLLITILGAFAYFTLAVAQYPEVAPPTLQVTATYPGASADVVSETVATPLEQQINGIENLQYFSSQSTGDGKLTLTLNFRLGTDLNTALVLTQSRVLIAQPRLPHAVQELGVTVKKVASDYVIVPHLYSPDGSRDQLYLSGTSRYTAMAGRPRIEARRSRLEGLLKSFGGQELQLGAEFRRARGAERLFKAALRLLPELHRLLEFGHPGGRENYPLDPAIFLLDPKPYQAIAHQRTQGMAHGGQIHQQTPGELRHGRIAEIITLREQAELGCLQAAWLQHGVVELSQTSGGFAKRSVVAVAQHFRFRRGLGHARLNVVFHGRSPSHNMNIALRERLGSGGIASTPAPSGAITPFHLSTMFRKSTCISSIYHQL
jgi:hypothetical protein